MNEVILQAAILISGIAGAVLNARQVVYGFHVWIVCNLLIIYSSMENNQIGMIALYVLYTGICVYGIYAWRLDISSRDRL
jgi:nicotinamide riboside transporter PnuC